MEAEKPIINRVGSQENYIRMLENILKINGVSEVSKKAQAEIQGGFGSCQVYDAALCQSCGGVSLSNGCCLILRSNESCLDGSGGIGG